MTTNDARLQPRQLIRQQRQCKTCGRVVRISVTTTGDGWQREAGECGHVVEWRIAGHPN